METVRTEMFIRPPARDSVPRILVIVTTDERRFADEAMIAAADAVKGDSIEVLAVVFGRSRAKVEVEDELKLIVSRPTESYSFTVTDAKSLSVIQQNFRKQLCVDIPGLFECTFIIVA